MLILCSNGLTSQIIRDELRKRLNLPCRAALVVTADNEYKEKNRHVERGISELEQLGMTVDWFDIDRHNSSMLLQYDVVEFIGGNPFYLLHSIRKHQCENIIKEIAERKILIGWSAAVFVFSPTLELVNRYSPEMNFLELKNLAALHLTDIQILPHYDRFLNRFDRFEERCCEYEFENHVNVIRIRDGEGVFIEDGKVRILRV